MTVTAKCPSCGHTHRVDAALMTYTHGGALDTTATFNLTHQQTALALEQSIRERDIYADDNARLRRHLAAQQEEIERLRARQQKPEAAHA